MIICELGGGSVRLRELVGIRRHSKPTEQGPVLNPYGCLLGLLLSAEPAERVPRRRRLFRDLSQFLAAIPKPTGETQLERPSLSAAPGRLALSCSAGMRTRRPGYCRAYSFSEGAFAMQMQTHQIMTH